MRLGTAVLLVPMLAGCGNAATGFAAVDGGGGGGRDATAAPDGTMSFVPEGGGGGGGADDGTLPEGSLSVCNPLSLDLAGCNCTQPNATRACYDGAPSTRNVGACKDGTQTCVAQGEFATWSKCDGQVLPAPPLCDGTIDTSCNGHVGCSNPLCANTPVCDTGCTDGQTRPCYDGPTGTENRGICHDGLQTCSNGQWNQTCAGEQLPEPINCCDAIDHACNGLPGCLNLFGCITASCCQSSCDAGAVDPGCVCMTGSGDTATCPQGDYYVHKGPVLGGTDECCPCTAANCGVYNCCGEAICANNSACSGMSCRALPASCNGQVSADCDDFPEDCDEPCCECTDGTC